MAGIVVRERLRGGHKADPEESVPNNIYLKFRDENGGIVMIRGTNNGFKRIDGIKDILLNFNTFGLLPKVREYIEGEATVVFGDKGGELKVVAKCEPRFSGWRRKG